MKQTYNNPIIYADVPDMDIIRSKDKDKRQVFYMVSTTMHLSPGVPIMKSYDLVNWETVNYVYRILEEEDRYALKNGKNDYSVGSWAASLRQDLDTGWFFVAFTCNSTQKTYIFMTDDIEKGPWYRTTFDGMCYDNGMFFDTTSGKKYIFFSDDCKDGIGTHDICYRELFIDIVSKSIQYGPKHLVLHNSNYETPKQGLWGEGFHVYQREGYYYIFVIQGQQWQRQEICFRSKSLTAQGRWDDDIPGAWECKKVFVGHLFDKDGNAVMKNNGIAQGGIVDTEDGQWYCFIFQDTGAVGRIPMLTPMKWGTEGEMKDWPIIGEYLGEDTEYLYNRMYVENDIPVKNAENQLKIRMNDEFDNVSENYRCYDRPSDNCACGNGAFQLTENGYNGSNISMQWQWNHNPDNRYWSLTERPGFLRLKPVGTVTNIREARNMLTVRTFGPKCAGTVLMDISKLCEGMVAGLTVFQRQYGYVAVRVKDNKKYLIMRKAEHKDDAEGKVYEEVLLQDCNQIYLKIECDFTDYIDEAKFFYSVDQETWNQVGCVLKMKYDIPDFMGYRYGVFAYSTGKIDGYADFDWFHWE